MAREVSFIIAVDLDSKEVVIDDGSFTARFDSNEQVWDTEVGEWRDFDGDEYEEALAILNNNLPKADGN